MVAHVHDTGKLYYAHAGAWVPVASESSLPNTFSTIAVAGQSSVVADSTTDTLTLTAGVGITLTTNASTDTITITSTARLLRAYELVRIPHNRSGYGACLPFFRIMPRVAAAGRS